MQKLSANSSTVGVSCCRSCTLLLSESPQTKQRTSTNAEKHQIRLKEKAKIHFVLTIQEGSQAKKILA